MAALRPEHYLQAAMERIEQAGWLYEQKASYALVIYLAGLAVECLFRAFKARRDPTFDERHDLKLLFQASGIQDKLPESEWGAFHADAAEVWVSWINSLRFYSEHRARAYLKRHPALRKGIKGDILKECAGRLLQASRRLAAKGVALWSS